MLTKQELPVCPWATTIWLIGNKWKLTILRNLTLFDTCRFEEFLKSIDGISRKVLTDNLRALERDGIIRRESFNEVPPRVEYSLTPLGDTLRPIFKLIGEWGEMYQRLVREQNDPS